MIEDSDPSNPSHNPFLVGQDCFHNFLNIVEDVPVLGGLACNLVDLVHFEDGVVHLPVHIGFDEIGHHFLQLLLQEQQIEQPTGQLFETLSLFLHAFFIEKIEPGCADWLEGQ